MFTKKPTDSDFIYSMDLEKISNYYSNFVTMGSL